MGQAQFFTFYNKKVCLEKPSSFDKVNRKSDISMLYRMFAVNLTANFKVNS